MRLRMSGRQKAVLAVALVFLMWLPTGVSHDEGAAIVTGHSTFWNGNGYDPCLASIAGMMRSRVMWFNDQVLVERYGGKGTYIYATEFGAPDPREHELFTEGVFYDFTDPNGAQWHVQEVWYAARVGLHTTSDTTTEGKSVGQRVDDALNGDPTSGGVQSEYSASTVDEDDKYHAWIVELSGAPIFDRFGQESQQYAHTFYNFLNLIDTCKFNRERLDELQDANDDPYPYYSNVNHSTGLSQYNGHPSGAAPHDHETWMIDLWIGKAPKVTPFGELSTDAESWESSWTGYAVNSTTNETESSVPEGFEESLP